MGAAISSGTSTFPGSVREQLRRIGPLGLIILLHIGFFYALQSGLLRQAAQALPQEVFATLVTPDPAPKPEIPKPQPPAPKPPEVKKPVVRRAPVAPVVKSAPTEKAVTAPQPAPPSPEPPAPAAQSQPAPAPAVSAPVTPAPPKTVSGVEYIEPPRPDYPPLAKRMGEEGKVMLRILVNEKGRPERVELQKSSGSARLDEAARQAAMRALFKPHLEDGRPVAVFVVVPINFSIQ